MTRIRSHVEKAQKISGPRALQPSQYGMVCPSDTPEGEQCGLVKSLTILAYITTDQVVIDTLFDEQDESALRQVAYDLGVLDIGLVGAEELYAYPSNIVFLNGCILGIHTQPNSLVRNIRLLRRRGLLGEFVSVYYDKVMNDNRDYSQTRHCVHLSCDGGRICRPLLVLNKQTGKPYLTKQHIEQLRRGVLSVNQLVKEVGIVIGIHDRV